MSNLNGLFVKQILAVARILIGECMGGGVIFEGNHEGLPGSKAAKTPATCLLGALSV